MALCRSCNSEGTRLRTIFERDGRPLAESKDECPKCAPGSFDRFTAPSDKKPAMGWEAYPTKYKKKWHPDGGRLYVGSDELRADSEAQMLKEPEAERLAREKAVAAKRAERRTQPLTAEEVRRIDERWRPLVAERQAQQERVREEQIRELDRIYGKQ